ncbi:MAG TPA: hypothetical protein VF794_19335 [Archangium sp.]|jgi:hypothetical protein|uniref:hypothetical protein n=1 Tax=Archangium sp. TaxID=1872627 RepID=UPI002EDB668F
MSSLSRQLREEIRGAILDAIPPDLSTHGTAPDPSYFYVPRRHAHALHPDNVLVRGIRGAGKSVWWAALQSVEHRKLLARVLPNVEVDENTKISAGFGISQRPDEYPDKRVLAKILKSGVSPELCWRTVIAWHTWSAGTPLSELKTWSARVNWVNDNPEESAINFADYDAKLRKKGIRHLILFDALDRVAETWEAQRSLLSGLLSTLLEFRSYSSLRAKAFVRPDMLEATVTNFPDASKVTANAADLKWQPLDLYSLLWQYLANSSAHGQSFRELSQKYLLNDWKKTSDVWRIPDDLRSNEEVQFDVFHEITGPWMGRDARRGLPYRWLPNHLADALGQVSPRSFLSALRTAAEHEQHIDPNYALHYEAIKRGVQAASQIRVDEVKEDFPWIGYVMEPLHGLVIPCTFDEIAVLWEASDIVNTLKRGEGLPPRRLSSGLLGLRRDLVELGLFLEMPDGRINIPDVYRVGFGLGRRGGVKPVR